MRLTAWDDPDGNTVVQDEVEDSITQIAINYNNAQLVITEASIGIGHATDFTVGGHSFTVVFVQNGVHTEALVDGVVGNNFAGGAPFTQIAAFTADGYNELQIGYDSLVLGPGQQPSFSTFKLGGFGATVINVGQPVDLSVPLTVTDGDGDTANSALNVFLMPAVPTTQDFSSSEIGVTATATATQPNILGSAHSDTLNGDGNANILYGAAGIDTLNGKGGDDTLIGNADGDTLNGGAGNDKFVLQLNSGSHDTIGDFLSGVDQILVDNGSGLIVGTAATVDLANFHTGDETVAATWNGGTGKEFVFNTASHELWYSANGTGTDKIDLAHISTGVPVATDIHTF